MKFLQIDHQDLLENLNRYNQSVITINGTLVVEGDASCLDIEGAEIRVSDDDFIDKLLDNVPCYVGGKYLYSDAAVIQGTLIVKNGVLHMENIKSVTISREQESFTF